MNEHAPLTPDDVDVLLSAELDGDLDDAARELGLSASEARSRLAAVPGVDERRQALSRARDLIAVAPSLEPADADRLVATALAPDDVAIARERRRRRERGWRVLVATGSVAAAIAVIVGIASMKPSGNSAKSSAASPTVGHSQNDLGAESGPPPGSASSLDLGDVTTEQGLRAPAQRLLLNLPKYATVKGGTSADAAVHPSSTQSSKSAGGVTFGAATPPACTRAALARSQITTAPTVIATGTASGAPVAVFIYQTPEGSYAYVVRVSDCTLLRRQSLG